MRNGFRSIAGPKTALTTFDSSYYGKDLHIPLEVPGLSRQALTYSTATFGYSHDEDFTPNSVAGSTSYTPLLQGLDRTISNIDSGFIMHKGNDTAFNQNFLLHADMTAVMHQIQLSFAVALNVSAYTSDNFKINSVSISTRSFQGASKPTPFGTDAPHIIEPESAFANLTATGTQIFIVRHALDVPDLLYQDQPFTINITVNETTGTGTRQVGIVPLFPLFADAGNKTFYQSGMTMHIHPIPGHTNELIPFLTTGGWRLTSQ